MDINKIRDDYPILQRQIEGRPLIYLDNAATSQTPRSVVEAIDQMYYHYKANVHRGVHTLSQEATDLVELTREKVRAFINALGGLLVRPDAGERRRNHRHRDGTPQQHRALATHRPA